MNRMTNEEIMKIFRELEEAGLNPQLCNTPVPYFDAAVQAGLPTDPGDVTPSGWMYLPDDLVSTGMFVTRVKGESMRDAGFEPGDRVVVSYEECIKEGDFVVATINNDSTIKSLMTDDTGVMWLVPHNSDFAPFRLTEDMGNIPWARWCSTSRPILACRTVKSAALWTSRASNSRKHGRCLPVSR